MKLQEFEKLIQSLSAIYEVEYDADSHHAYIKVEGWQLSFAFLIKKGALSLATEHKMPLGKFAEFLSQLNDSLELLLLKDKAVLYTPGSYVPNKKMEFIPMEFSLPHYSKPSNQRFNRIVTN